MLPVNNNPDFPLQTYLRSTGDAPSSSSVSQTATVPLRPDEYYALWAEWEENAPPGMGEKRDIAVARMRECLETGRKLLNLAELSPLQWLIMLKKHGMCGIFEPGVQAEF